MTFDATVAGASANSYLLVAAADAFATADVGPMVDAWTAADTATKQRVLQRATREVDAYLRSSGTTRYSGTQLLLYPRPIDVSGSTPYIPVPIQLAVWAQAKYLTANAKVLDAAATRRARGMQSASEPTVSYTRDTSSADLLSEEALGHLQGAFAGAATIRSVIVGTVSTYPVLGDPGLDLLP